MVYRHINLDQTFYYWNTATRIKKLNSFAVSVKFDNEFTKMIYFNKCKTDLEIHKYIQDQLNIKFKSYSIINSFR